MHWPRITGLCSRNQVSEEARITGKRVIAFNIPIKPKAKGRPRAGRNGMYTDKSTREYEDAIRQAYIDLDLPKLEGNLQITVNFQKDNIWVQLISVKEESKLRGDVDNYVKSLLDGLNGVAYDDDKQIVNLKAFKR